MDVHDLWMALVRQCAATPERDHEKVASLVMVRPDDMKALLPLIEAHTRAAVEAERAACEAHLRGKAKDWASEYAVAARLLADELAARKAQP
jgi:hypothetical protein